MRIPLADEYAVASLAVWAGRVAIRGGGGSCLVRQPGARAVDQELSGTVFRSSWLRPFCHRFPE